MLRPSIRSDCKLHHEISRAQSCTSLKIVSPINRFAIESNVTKGYAVLLRNNRYEKKREREGKREGRGEQKDTEMNKKPTAEKNSLSKLSLQQTIKSDVCVSEKYK